MILDKQNYSSPKLQTITDFSALKAIWNSLRMEEDSTPPERRLGVAMRRMELLSTFPENERAAVIDQLNEGVFA